MSRKKLKKIKKISNDKKVLTKEIYITIDKRAISINLSEKEKNNKKVKNKEDNEEKEMIEKQEEIKLLDLSKCLNNNNNTIYNNL